MQDAWRAYLELALGLTEASRKRAQTVARKVVGSSGATAAQLQELAEELLSAGMANREALNRMIRTEVHRTLGVVGLATTEELDGLRVRVEELERRLREVAEAGATAPAVTQSGSAAVAAQLRSAGETGDPGAVVNQPAAKKALAKKTVAKKAVVKKTVAKKAVVKKAVPGEEAARGTAGKQLPPATS